MEARSLWQSASALAVLLTGCQTTDDRHARLHPYIGRTMAEFSQGTGLVPSDMYNTAQGRVFIVNGPTTAVAVAPGVAVQGGCRMQVETVSTGATSTADNWRITAITAHGPC